VPLASRPIQLRSILLPVDALPMRMPSKRKRLIVSARMTVFEARTSRPTASPSMRLPSSSMSGSPS
jgi:hypothetical protein